MVRVAEIMHKFLYSDFHADIMSCTRSDTLPDVNTRNLSMPHLYVRPVFPRIDVVKLRFIYQYAIIWNKIPLNIRNTPDFKTLKKMYISHLLDS